MLRYSALYLLTVPVMMGCGGDSSPDPAARQPLRARPLVMSVNYPLDYFASRLAGDEFEVAFPIPPGIDPAFWNPDPESITAFQGADIVLLNGANYAKWMDHVTLPPSILVNTSAGVADQYITVESSVTHRHGPEGEHSHTGIAFTTWLDPNLATAQAESVAAALQARRPAAGPQIQQRLDDLNQEITEWRNAMQSAVGDRRQEPILCSHPVYDYLIRAADLNAVSLHWEPDQMPSDDQWAELKKILTSHPARWMIWEGDPQDAIRERLKQLGIDSVVVSPCANRPLEGDWMTVMHRNAANLATVFAEPVDRSAESSGVPKS